MESLKLKENKYTIYLTLSANQNEKIIRMWEIIKGLNIDRVNGACVVSNKKMKRYIYVTGVDIYHIVIAKKWETYYWKNILLKNILFQVLTFNPKIQTPIPDTSKILASLEEFKLKTVGTKKLSLQTAKRTFIKSALFRSW